jgi:hypothetical protein
MHRPTLKNWLNFKTNYFVIMAVNVLAEIIYAICVGYCVSVNTYECPTKCSNGCLILPLGGKIQCANPGSFCTLPSNYNIEIEVRLKKMNG